MVQQLAGAVHTCWCPCTANLISLHIGKVHSMQLKTQARPTRKVAHADAQLHHLLPAPYQGTALGVWGYGLGGVRGTEKGDAKVHSHTYFNLHDCACEEKDVQCMSLWGQGRGGTCTLVSLWTANLQAFTTLILRLSLISQVSFV